MFRNTLKASVVLASLLILAATAVADTDPEDVVIVVSPSVLNLQSEGVWVTVHAEIPYSDVAGLTVTLDGIPVEYTKSDARGELVAKFNLDDVKEILDVGDVELTLAGETWDGGAFSGTDMIKVIDQTGRR